MLDETGNLALGVLDFPNNFVNRVHQDDLKEFASSGAHEVILHNQPAHHRIYLRYVILS